MDHIQLLKLWKGVKMHPVLEEVMISVVPLTQTHSREAAVYTFKWNTVATMHRIVGISKKLKQFFDVEVSTFQVICIQWKSITLDTL